MVIISALTLIGCRESPSVLDPRGPRAGNVAELAWLFFVLAGAVYAAVVILLLIGLFRRRREEAPPRTAGERLAARLHEPVARLAPTTFVTVAGVIVPAIILTILLVLNVRSMVALSAPETPARVVIDVVGYQYWWEVRYPNHTVITANEVHIPVGEPVQLNLTSVDVIHSFWVPQLQGKMDLIPGRINTTWLQADQEGTFLGECAEFCGVQHAKMAFVVVAEPPERFEAWLAQQRQPATEPTDPYLLAGYRALMRPSCIGCHALSGTPAQGRVGPDLTHMGSRLTIAGGALPNNRGTLAAWIADPQGLKPGNLMPDLAIDLQTADAIAAYLGSLK